MTWAWTETEGPMTCSVMDKKIYKDFLMVIVDAYGLADFEHEEVNNRSRKRKEKTSTTDGIMSPFTDQNLYQSHLRGEKFQCGYTAL